MDVEKPGKSSSEPSSHTVPISSVTLKDYMARLALLKESPYRDYFDAFISTFCQAREVADIVSSGKIHLANNKREQALSYGISLLGDAGGAFIPTGTLAKLINDVCGYFIQEHRKKKHEKVAEATANPFHFILLAQALVDSILFYFEPEEWCTYSPNIATRNGRAMATKLIEAIKEKKVALSEDANLAVTLGACLQFIINQELIISERTYPEWVAGQHEPILLLATAQLLNLPADYFLKADEFIEQLEVLEKKVSRMAINGELDNLETPEEKAAAKKKAIAAIQAPDTKAEECDFSNSSAEAFSVKAPNDLTEEEFSVLTRFIQDTQPDKVEAYIQARNATTSKCNFAGARVRVGVYDFTSSTSTAQSLAKHGLHKHKGEQDKAQNQTPTNKRKAVSDKETQEKPRRKK
jgi:hypothetical protein